MVRYWSISQKKGRREVEVCTELNMNEMDSGWWWWWRQPSSQSKTHTSSSPQPFLCFLSFFFECSKKVKTHTHALYIEIDTVSIILKKCVHTGNSFFKKGNLVLWYHQVHCTLTLFQSAYLREKWRLTASLFFTYFWVQWNGTSNTSCIAAVVSTHHFSLSSQCLPRTITGVECKKPREWAKLSQNCILDDCRKGKVQVAGKLQ